MNTLPYVIVLYVFYCLVLPIVIVSAHHDIYFFVFFFFQAEDGIRDCLLSRGLGDVYKRQDYSGI